MTDEDTEASPAAEPAAERPRVKPISRMDNETFLKHMNARHVGVAGVRKWGRSNVPDDAGENLLRIMHETLHTHDLYIPDTNHDHTSYTPRGAEE